MRTTKSSRLPPHLDLRCIGDIPRRQKKHIVPNSTGMIGRIHTYRHPDDNVGARCHQRRWQIFRTSDHTATLEERRSSILNLPTIELHRTSRKIIVRTTEQGVKQGCTVYKGIDERTAKPFGGWCSISYNVSVNARKAKSPTKSVRIMIIQLPYDECPAS